MDRRNFLRLLAGAAIAPKVSYFLPPIGGWHSDVIAHPRLALNLDAVTYAHMSEISAWPDCSLEHWKAVAFDRAVTEFYYSVWIPWERLRNEKLGTIATDDSWLLCTDSQGNTTNS